MLTEGQNIGPYVVTEQLGSGGMATVYKAYHPRLDRYIAIKIMHQAFLEDQSFHARFEREAQIVARLEHPNIVPVYDFSEYQRQPYLVMKYIEGRTLKHVLAEDGPPALDEIVRLMTPLADALTYAHERGVLHRDIKPSNIIIDASGVPYLTDFGLARIAQAGESTISQDMLLGTPQYISPEQAKGGVELDARADIYSLGVILYELLVGRVPFSADTPYAVVHDHIYTPLPLPSKVNPDIPKSVEKVLVRALSKKPEERYTSAREMLAALKKAVDSAGRINLKPDRAKSAAISLANLRAQMPPPPPPPPDEVIGVPSPLRPPRLPEPPDPEKDPAGYARWQVEMAREKVDEALDKVLGPDRAERLAKPIDWIESKVVEKIEEEARKGRLVIDEGVFVSGKKPNSAHIVIKPDKKRKRDKQREEANADEGLVIDATNLYGASPDTPAPESEEGLHEAFYRNLDDMSEVGIRRRVETQFKMRSEFFSHVGAYIMTQLLLMVIYMITRQWGGIFAIPWPLLVLFGWGAGLADEGIKMYFNTGRRAERHEDRIEQEMEQAYGSDWHYTVGQDEYLRIRRELNKTYRKRVEFYQQLGVYFIVIPMLWLVWYFTLMLGWGGIFTIPWPILVMIGWAIGLMDMGVKALGDSGRRAAERERAIQRELERRRVLESKAKRDSKLKREDEEPGLRLTQDGELTESFAEEWEQIEARKRRR